MSPGLPVPSTFRPLFLLFLSGLDAVRFPARRIVLSGVECLGRTEGFVRFEFASAERV